MNHKIRVTSEKKREKAGEPLEKGSAKRRGEGCFKKLYKNIICDFFMYSMHWILKKNGADIP